jgi:hypothetical protein
MAHSQKHAGILRRISARLGLTALAKATPVTLGYGLIKAPSGILDPDFALGLARDFDLPVFIETGTYRGDTIWPLLAGFERIFSVELDEGLHQAARLRFAEAANVTLLQGDSASTLAAALKQRGKRPALIWLDAHFSGIGTAFGERTTPVHEELDLIFASNNAGDVILIDDLRCFRRQSPAFDMHDSLEGYPQAAEIADRLKAKGYLVLVMCDSLLAILASAHARVATSPVLQACTRLRLDVLSPQERMVLEAVVAGAEGAERAALLAIPDFIKLGIQYGLGADYFYWRSLLTPPEDPALATADKDYARKCGIPVTPSSFA